MINNIDKKGVIVIIIIIIDIIVNIIVNNNINNDYDSMMIMTTKER